jgi:curved DNA-binding protein CbpA
LKTHYELLSIERTAPPDEVKRAFRREIARYHPDKVQHLGSEFQQIAATRAAELTEAYRILMDVELRRSYDEGLGQGGAPRPSPHTTPASQPESPEPDPPAGPRDQRYQAERATTVEFLKRAMLVKFSDAVEAFGGEKKSAGLFDAAYLIKGRRGLFKKADPDVRLLLRAVPVVDAASLEEAWMPAARGASAEEAVCLLLLGNGVAPAKELSLAVSDLRRRSRQAGPVVIPVDVRDWEALFPPDTPGVVRTLLERLRTGR